MSHPWVYPSVPFHPIVLWDGQDYVWDFHMFHRGVYPSVPSRLILPGDGWNCLWDSHMSHPQYTPKSQYPVPSHSPVGWTGLLNFLPALKFETFSTLPGRVRQNASFYHYFLLYISCTLRCSCCFLA